MFPFLSLNSYPLITGSEVQVLPLFIVFASWSVLSAWGTDIYVELGKKLQKLEIRW